MTFDPVTKVPNIFAGPENPKEEKFRVLDEVKSVKRDYFQRCLLKRSQCQARGLTDKEDDPDDRASIVKKLQHLSKLTRPWVWFLR